jgi:hypothetical protein
MLSIKEIEKLGDDIKLIAKAVKVMGQENDQVKRQFALGLVQDLVDRLYNDICEFKEKKCTD